MQIMVNLNEMYMKVKAFKQKVSQIIIILRIEKSSKEFILILCYTWNQTSSVSRDERLCKHVDQDKYYCQF